jgi:hypothetical protein
MDGWYSNLPSATYPDDKILLFLFYEDKKMGTKLRDEIKDLLKMKKLIITNEIESTQSKVAGLTHHHDIL